MPYDNDGPIQVTAQENPALLQDSPTLTPVYLVNTGRDGQTVLTQLPPQSLLRSSQSGPAHIFSPPHMVLSSSPQYGPLQQLVSLVQRTGSPSPRLLATRASPLPPKLKHTSSSGSSSDSTSGESDGEEHHAMGTSPSPSMGTSPRTSPPPLQSMNVLPQQSILVPQSMQHILVPMAPKQQMFLQPTCIGSGNSVLQLAYPDGQLKMIQQPVLIGGRSTSTQQSLQLVTIANNTPATHVHKFH